MKGIIANFTVNNDCCDVMAPLMKTIMTNELTSKNTKERAHIFCCIVQRVTEKYETVV